MFMKLTPKIILKTDNKLWIGSNEITGFRENKPKIDTEQPERAKVKISLTTECITDLDKFNFVMYMVVNLI